MTTQDGSRRRAAGVLWGVPLVRRRLSIPTRPPLVLTSLESQLVEPFVPSPESDKQPTRWDVVEQLYHAFRKRGHFQEYDGLTPLEGIERAAQQWRQFRSGEMEEFAVFWAGRVAPWFLCLVELFAIVEERKAESVCVSAMDAPGGFSEMQGGRPC